MHDCLASNNAALQSHVKDVNAKLLASNAMQAPRTPDSNPTTQKLVTDAWNSGKIPLNVARVPGNLVVARDGLLPRQPSQTSILTDRPIFNWSGIPDARAYEIEVYRLRGDRPEATPVARGKVDAAQSSWRSNVPLARQHDYEWRLHAVLGNGSHEDAANRLRFRVASLTVQQRYVWTWQRQAVLAARDGLYENALDALNNIIAAQLDSQTTAHAVRMRNDLQKQHGSPNGE